MISPPCRKNDVVNQILYDLRWLDIRPLSAPDTCIISEVGKKVINYFSKYLQIILKPFYVSLRIVTEKLKPVFVYVSLRDVDLIIRR